MLPALPKQGEHVAIVGQNDCGKTTTAIILLERCAYYAPVLIVDTKGEDSLEQLPGVVYDDPNEALASPDWITIYRPDDFYNSPEQVDAFLRATFRQRRPALYLYIDEIFQCVVGTSQTAARGTADLLMRGRRRIDPLTGSPVTMSVIISSQSPVWIPVCVWRETSHKYVHYMGGRNDRINIAQYTGFAELIVEKPATGHEFYYHKRNTFDEPPAKFEWSI